MLVVSVGDRQLRIETGYGLESLLTDALRKKYKMYEDQYTAEEISRLLRVRYEMERIQFGYYNPYVLAESVSPTLVSYLEERGVSGINFKTNAKRIYPYGAYASHILGRVGKIQAPLYIASPSQISRPQSAFLYKER